MIVLFSALMIVYLLLYQIKGDDIVNQLSVVQNQNVSITPSENETWYEDLYEDQWEINWTENETLLFEEDSASWTKENELQEKTDSLFDQVEKKDQTWSAVNKIIVLSWTSLWYGRVEAVEKLWISYQYALKDQKDIYYVFLDPQRYKFDEIVKALWWSIYTITTEKEMVENKLFWDKVTFINLPEYKEKKVVMLIEYEKKLWLIQVDYATYYKSKWYIKQLFIH